MPRFSALAALLAAGLLLASAALPVAAADARRLHMEQQHDALNLQLQQSARARRHDLGPSDERRLDQLHLQQRMQQQQLDIGQVQRERALRQPARSDPAEPFDRRFDAQREIFSAERQLQSQQFELDRQRLLQSMPRQPLQPPLGAGQLN
ncbi:MAG TPA: hypothetical protein VD867_01870 [Burkholderiales bacterium]|nr:hypothetical protein [Burkholderiales bacterium]